MAPLSRAPRRAVGRGVVAVLVALLLGSCTASFGADQGLGDNPTAPSTVPPTIEEANPPPDAPTPPSTSEDEAPGPGPTEPDTAPEDPQVGDLDANNADERNPNGWFEAGRSWWGDFGDPFVLVDGDRFIAYGSSAEGRYVPVVTSTDLRTWYALDRWSASPPPWEGGPDPLTDPDIPVEIRTSPLSENRGDVWNLNDALVLPAEWGLSEPVDLWVDRTMWAPSVARFGRTWNLYYAVRVSRESDDRNGDGRFCISVATSQSPTGPFRDRSEGPIVCDVDPAGSIDPEVFSDPETGSRHLLWKAAGKVDAYPTALKSIELDHRGHPVSGAPSVTLLETDESSWEGETIENPSMVWWENRYILVYSGNAWRADGNGESRYATGWAECPDGPRASCTRGGPEPLLASEGSEQGPAGGSLFVTEDGRLYLAYAAFRRGEGRDPRPRRLAIVELELDSRGRLTVGRAP